MVKLSRLFILVSIVTVGCAKIDTEDPRQTLCHMAFSASVSTDAEVKTAIDALDIKWSTGDRIGVFDGVAVREFILKSGAGGTDAVFEGEISPADRYVAVYPYTENLTVGRDGKIHGTSISRIQNVGDGCNDATSTIMTASCVAGSNTLKFKNAVAYIKVTPEFTCHKIVLDACGSEICGDEVLTVSDESVSTSTDSDTNATTERLTGDDLIW